MLCVRVAGAPGAPARLSAPGAGAHIPAHRWPAPYNVPGPGGAGGERPLCRMLADQIGIPGGPGRRL